MKLMITLNKQRWTWREKGKRVELQESLLPRRLYIESYVDNTSNIDVLKEIDGTRVLVETIPDFEANRTANNIAAVFSIAGLNVLGVRITEIPAPDGVSVEQYLTAKGITPDERKADGEAYTRTKIIADFLEKNGILAIRGWSKRGELPPDVTLRIRVGFKPNLGDRWTEDAMKRMRANQTNRKQVRTRYQPGQGGTYESHPVPEPPEPK